MKRLYIPHGTPGVRWYRYENALTCMGEKFDRWEPEDGEGFLESAAEFLEKRGLDWQTVWTGNYWNECQAVLDELRWRGADLVIDVDDWFEDLPEGNMAADSWLGEKRRLYKELLGKAARVSASTPVLAEKYGGIVTPNFVVPEQWDWAPRSSVRADECVILCNASPSRAGDYLAKEGPFRKTLELPHVKMVFMGGVFPEWALDYPAGKVIWCRWTPIEIYPRMMRWIAPDIVVSPLEHNEFNVAKSNLKWLEAGMCGAAFVGERWGEYARTVNDGTTGVLAEGEAEWTEALMGLALNAETRQHVAEAGRAEVLRNWTWDAVAPQWRKAVLGEA